MEPARKRELRRQYLERQRAAERAALGLSAQQLRDLRSYLDQVQALGLGCDRSLTHTRRWAAQEGLDPESVAMALVELGGNCDCMVTMNVKPYRFGWPPEDDP